MPEIKDVSTSTLLITDADDSDGSNESTIVDTDD